MNQDIKTKWIASLNSGEYEQGRKVLRTGQSYCCLGVLCDLYIKEHNDKWGPTERRALGDETIDAYTYDECSGILPPKVADWADLARNPETTEKTEVNTNRTIADLNDGGYSFEQIAIVIERDL